MAVVVAVASFLAGGSKVEAAANLTGSLVGLILGLLVPVIGWSRWGTTPGKALLGLYVCDVEGRVGLSPGRSFLRWVGYVVSALPLGLGFAMVGLNANRRGLHDLIASTYVGQRPR
jgi:uncharacterized RDD family membrane protein YckC